MTFTEFLAPGDDLRRSRRRHQDEDRQKRQTLFSLAEAYGDSTLWRPIATANGLDDPFAPPIGQRAGDSSEFHQVMVSHDGQP